MPSSSGRSRGPSFTDPTLVRHGHARVPRVAKDPEEALSLRRPGHWRRRHVDHAGWFTTGVTWDLPDGMSARWASRRARRRGLVELRDASGAVIGNLLAEPVTARR